MVKDGEIMLIKSQNHNREQIQFLSIDDLVPQNHILRDIDRAIDFSFIYDLVKDLYCHDNGRPSIDPVILFKIVLTQFLFGIRSMRQTIKEIEVNMACRRFLGYGMTDEIPHFTTFGKNYTRRFADILTNPKNSPTKHHQNSQKTTSLYAICLSAMPRSFL